MRVALYSDYSGRWRQDRGERGRKAEGKKVGDTRRKGKQERAARICTNHMHFSFRRDSARSLDQPVASNTRAPHSAGQMHLRCPIAAQVASPGDFEAPRLSNPRP